MKNYISMFSVSNIANSSFFCPSKELFSLCNNTVNAMVLDCVADYGCCPTIMTESGFYDCFYNNIHYAEAGIAFLGGVLCLMAIIGKDAKPLKAGLPFWVGGVSGMIINAVCSKFSVPRAWTGVTVGITSTISFFSTCYGFYKCRERTNQVAPVLNGAG